MFLVKAFRRVGRHKGLLVLDDRWIILQLHVVLNTLVDPLIILCVEDCFVVLDPLSLKILIILCVVIALVIWRVLSTILIIILVLLIIRLLASLPRHVLGRVLFALIEIFVDRAHLLEHLLLEPLQLFLCLASHPTIFLVFLLHLLSLLDMIRLFESGKNFFKNIFFLFFCPLLLSQSFKVHFQAMLQLRFLTQQLLEGLALVVDHQEWQVGIHVEFLEGTESVFRDYILFLVFVADVIRDVGNKIYEGVRNEAYKVHCFLLGAYALRQGLLYNLVESG